MGKPKVTLKFNGSLKVLKENLVNRALQQDLGETVIANMKGALAVGLSPVQGFGRLDAYAAQRKGDRVSYPFSVMKQYPSKTVRPINLKLTGALQDSLDWTGIKRGVELGHLNLSRDIKNKFEAHNEGLNRYVPQRKYLPNERGELFIVSIMRVIKDIYLERIKSIINNNR